MSFMNTTLLSAADATTTQSTDPIDTTRVQQGSFSVTTASLAGTPSIAVVVEGSNAVPPNGVLPGNGWTVPAASWKTLTDSSGDIDATITADGLTVLKVPQDSLLMRWVRVKATPTDVSGGTITVDVFLRDTGS
jgi:hypothetical protein